MASAAERQRRRREALRRAGLRPVTIWAPNPRAPGFVEEARAQARRLRDDPAEDEALDWTERAAADQEGAL